MMQNKSGEANRTVGQRGQRRDSGAGIIVICFILGFWIMLALGIFAYEANRVNIAHDELRSACEAAALAGAAALASSNETTTSNTHDLAQAAAEQAFVTNTILGSLLSSTTATDSGSGKRATSTAAATYASNPGPNAAVMYLEFLQVDNATVAAWNSPSGRIVHVVGSFGEVPSFGQFIHMVKDNSPGLGNGKVVVYAEAKARVPQLDVVMCFDVSGSIDDQTFVTFVRRRWMIPAVGAARIVYEVANNSAGLPANGTLYDILRPAPAGTGVQANAPQNLSTASIEGRPVTWRPTLRSTGSDVGTSPGNYTVTPDTTTAATYPTLTHFTDLVVNLADVATKPNNVFVPYAYTDLAGVTWNFPSLGALVEAARGNLEATGSPYTTSRANIALGATVTPKDGYQAAYREAAQRLARPIGEARLAAIKFFTIMNNNTDGTFGFVSFGDIPVGTTPLGTAANQNRISAGYDAPAQIFTPTYPGQLLGPSNFATIIGTVIPRTIANGCTPMGTALDTAVNNLIASGRAGSTKTVIMFTDGHENCGTTWNGPAATAKTKQIAIYTVGLAQNSAIIPLEIDNLNDGKGKTVNYTDPITGLPGSYTPSVDGMAAVAGNGGKSFIVTNSDTLNYVFENIARGLVHGYEI